MTRECQNLLKGLLNRNVEQRLGCGSSTMFAIRGIQAIKQHPFFRKIDWNKLYRKQLDPPIKPCIGKPTFFESCYQVEVFLFFLYDLSGGIE